jgi:hypothetical protein
MIAAPTFNAGMRIRNNQDGDSVKSETIEFISGLNAREKRTSRVPFSQAVAPMDENGTLGGVKPTSEGWRHLCNEIAPGLYTYLRGWESRAMGKDRVQKIQMQTFNSAFEARRRDLGRHQVTLVETPDGQTTLEAITSPRYQLIPNLELLLKSPQIFGSDIELATIDVKGRQMQATFIDPRHRKKIHSERAQEGEVIDLGFSLKNSEDRSMTVGVNCSAYLQHCTNGMRSTKSIHNVSARHVGRNVDFRKLASLNSGELSGVIDMMAESSQVRLDDGSLKTHTSWVAKRTNKEMASSLVSPSVAYKGYHGQSAMPTVFDVFNAITEMAHADRSLDVEKQIQLEGLGFDYIRYAMS